MTTACAFIEDRLPAYVAGELDTAERAHVDAHLRVCGDCTAEVEVIAMLRRHKPDVPGGLEARVRAAASQRRLLARPAFAVSALLAASLAGALLLGQRFGRDADVPVQPRVAFTPAQTYEAGLLPQVADPILANTDLYGRAVNISDEEMKRIISEVEL